MEWVLLPNIEIVEGGYPPDKKFLTYLWSSLSHVSESRLIIETPEGKKHVFSVLISVCNTLHIASQSSFYVKTYPNDLGQMAPNLYFHFHPSVSTR